ncbi:hydroxypyruvate isomerase family protein [Embleya sp. NPDC001921]
MQASRWRTAANVSLLFHDLPFLERPAAAAGAGFDAVEMWWPFPTTSPSRRDVRELVSAVNDAGIDLVALNFAAGNMAAGERGLMNDPAGAAAFRDSVAIAVDVAAQTGCRLFNALYGNRLQDVADESQHETASANLTWAAEAVAEIGATVLVEALNGVENPHYLLPTAADAADVVAAARSAGSPNVALLADVYHWAAGGEDPAAATAAHGPLIAHVQLADHPGRHEPGTGDIDFPAVYAQLHRHDYHGALAAEYRPLANTTGGLAWLHRLPRSAR